MERFWAVALRDRWARACSRDIKANVGDALRSAQPCGRLGAVSGDEIMVAPPMGSGEEISFPWNMEALLRGLGDGDDIEEAEVSGVKVDPVTDLDKDVVAVRDSVTVAVESLRATPGGSKTERAGAGVDGSSAYDTTRSGFA